MNLLKTSGLTFISTTIKLLAGLVINKAVAIYIGPAGLALIGQFQNFMTLAMTAAQGAINSGVTKYSAEYGKDSHRLPILFSTASKISLTTSVLVGAVTILFSDYISLQFLKTESYSYVFVILGFSIVLFVFNSLLLSILNGIKEIKAWITINIIQSFYSLVFTTLLIVFLGIDGALIALVTNQSVIFFVVLWQLKNHQIIKLENFNHSFSLVEAKKLSGFAAMGITSAASVPLSHLFIRNHIGETISWEAAGHWQAIWYISSMYLMVVTTALSTYFLPRLSEIKDKSELRKELLSGYKIIMPMVLLTSFIIFCLKDLIIWLLFTKDFAPMRELFMWQLIGDIMKLASWLLAYLMLAKALTKKFIITEIVFSVTFVLLSFIFLTQHGLIGMSYAFALNYSLYFLTMVKVTKSEWS